MTIPEIDVLFVISVCGLSVVCTGFVGVLLLAVVRLATGALGGIVGGDLFGAIPELIGLAGDQNREKADVPRRASTKRDLRAKADQYDFDAALNPNQNTSDPLDDRQRPQAPQQPRSSRSQPPPGRQQPSQRRPDDSANAPDKPETLGDYLDQRPSSRERLQARMRDLDLKPPGKLSDDPDAVNKPAPPDFDADDGPNTRSNIGGRVGRHNTGRGQEGQRNEADASDVDGLGNYVSRKNDEDRRISRNRRNRDIYSDGSRFDVDGDGDVDA